MGRVDRMTDRMGWTACGASVIGAAHRRRDTANQDAFRCRSTPTGVVAVVADGHGAAEHPRSGHGARLAADLLADRLAANAVATNDHEQLREFVAQFVDAWRAAVLAAVETQPFSAAEAGALQERTDTDIAVTAHGTTVLALVVNDSCIAGIAIGDGDIGCAGRDGRHLALCAAPEAIGVATDSLASSDPIALTRIETRSADDMVAAWACTDGFSTAQVEPNWRELVAHQLRELTAVREVSDVEANLANWLRPAAETGGDDTTMVLALRSGAGFSAR
jgi:hypothetical protein